MPQRTVLRRGFLVGVGGATVIALALEPVFRQMLQDRQYDLGMLQLVLAYNTGVGFSVAAGQPVWILVIVTAALSLTLVIYGWRSAGRVPTIMTAGLALMAGGACANVIDRALDGRVTDYFHTGWWPTFNVADVFLSVGVVVMIIGAVWQERRPAASPLSRSDVH
ncbi:signal peptidase II [Williamsia sp. 1135]|jgi:signal peptidase II|uniref:signal peptidase II n=1 Tax=Williamsia sp. 1135 TaxID=1889262 RepID=UPI000A1042B4|nr:signal peptidase II [Williamsia sp. 1135]ORM37200.1 signal peptidase II [Williamsia sp. 1135]